MTASDGTGRGSAPGTASALTTVSLGYPLLISVGMAIGRPRLTVVIVALVMLVPAALAWRSGLRGDSLWRLTEIGLVMAFLLVAAFVNDEHVFRLGPALTNVAMLLSFGRTLVSGPSLVESIARRVRHGGPLPDGAVSYCWRLTALWCVFFGLNAAFITWLAFYASLASWALYTGVLAYLIAGGLFMAELVYRHRRFANVAS
jgi:uncharacterized membrane protein